MMHDVIHRETRSPGGLFSRPQVACEDGDPAVGAARENHLSIATDWQVWQLLDSSFPTGGYAHSSGLEAAWQHGAVPHARAFSEFLVVSLDQLSHATLPFVASAYDEPERIVELDELCDAFTANHVANRASRLQGRAFAMAVKKVFGVDVLAQLSASDGSGWCGHFAPVFGAGCRALRLSRSATLRGFMFNQLRGFVAAGVRLNIVGPMEAQRLQHRLTPIAEEILERCSALGIDDVCQTAPMLDLWQGAHDRLYSRLFQS